MSYTYVFDLYNQIEQRMEFASRQLESRNESSVNNHFQKGQIDMLIEFKKFLEDHFDHRLPKAIAKKKNY